MNRFVFILLFCTGILVSACSHREPYFKMRGVVLTAEDLATVDWAKLAYENGINTIGVHSDPSAFYQTEKGKQFLADCKKYGIAVEYQLHAMERLLPRALFNEDSTMFRMNKEGRRVNDFNLCVHSQKALDVVAQNALKFAKLYPSGNHRYYFWMDDVSAVCCCPECSEYSDSEKALIVENRMIKALRTFDPEARLAHLAYGSAIFAPRRVKPEEGIFFEFAPIGRIWNKPLTDTQAIGREAGGPDGTGTTHQFWIDRLKENLTVFPAETAVILEYWLDVSLFSSWKKPAVKLPWHKEVFESDIDFYASLGIQNITSFAVYVDGKYLAAYDNDVQFLKDYGVGLKNYKKKK